MERLDGGGLLTRRRLLELAAATGMAAALPLPLRALAGTATEEYDDGNSEIPGGLDGEPVRVIIVGAGWAGLTAANALRNAGIDCVVVEGRRRLGGRAHTKDVGGVPIDLGCSWIHDPVGNPLTQFATQAGVAQTSADIEGDAALIRFFDGHTGADVPLPAKLETFAHLVQFEEEMEGLSDELGPRASARDGVRLYLDRHGLAGDARRYAEFLLRMVLQQSDAINWGRLSFDYTAHFDPVYTGVGQGNFPVGGYRLLIEAMAGATDVRLGHRVRRVERGAAGVRVIAQDRATGRVRALRGSHVLVTVPLGVLQHGEIEFSPPLPAHKRRGLRGLWAGHFEKAALTFSEPFWEDDLSTHILHISDRVPLEFPLFLDLQRISGSPALVGLCSANFARAAYRLPRRRILALVTAVLENVHGGSIPAPEAVAFSRWSSSPYTRGAFSSVPLGGSLDGCDLLARPVGGRFLFAGEATSRARIGYADGGLSTGVREAKRLLQRSSVQLSAG